MNAPKEVQQLLGLALLRIGDIALAGDGQQQRMDPGGVHGVDLLDPGDHGGDQRAGQLVDERAEGGVLLGGTADGGKGEDGIPAVIDRLHLNDREFVGQAVVPEMVAEGPLRQGLFRVKHPADAEIGLGRQRQLTGDTHHGNAPAGQQPGKRQLRHPFR